MKFEFVKSLSKFIRSNPNTTLITADLGFGMFEPIIENFPNNYLNIGVCEQNMIGVAAGMALEGRQVIVYSIGNFSTLRCLEQIRNDLCYHNARVLIVTGGGGLSYGTLGMTHHATEDLSIMRSLPGLQVVAPATDLEAGEATSALLASGRTSYLRLERKGCEEEQDSFLIGKSSMLRDGKDMTIVSTGSLLSEAVLASEMLKQEGINCRVINMATIKPLDVDAIEKASLETGGIITLEENNILGGLGGAVAEVCMDLGLQPKYFFRLGLNDQYSEIVGSQNYLRECYGLHHKKIAHLVRIAIKEGYANRPTHN